MPYYQFYELGHAFVGPMRLGANLTKTALESPLNPLASSPVARNFAAGIEVFERATRRYVKPAFGLPETVIDGKAVPVRERTVWSHPFCDLLHFERGPEKRDDPKLLIVAPMSGHYATLLRGTVETLLPDHDVYITDWVDARMVPLSEGQFDLDDYVDVVIEMLQHFDERVHVLAVCQPSVPVLAAISLMEAQDNPKSPLSMTLMGGPIDTRENPTTVNKLAEDRGTQWFADNVIMKVPFPHPGFMRDVYPGFLQLSGFMSMNLDKHLLAQNSFFQHLIEGDGDSAEKHRDFYDEYLAVMDLTAEYYLQTVDTVFVKHLLPKGEMMHRGAAIDPSKITRTALMTVEGELDDISGVGQTKAAHLLCSGLDENKREHLLQPAVGHYGVFNGSRFRSDIAPRIGQFIRKNATE